MGRFDISPEVAEEWRGKFRESQAGALAHGASTLVGKKRAGGLPES